ncbi:TPA: SAM-dependent DNA methyltransferase [Vibrio parahaemolyticus]|uniref:type I restriction-modification system subunit M n=1 Tax=Vibrio parahaemolyticus TaxID=670 RepID=UPI0011243373|nr:class I SAM-dependent DNA methyltransferase [Vibrio parahaemolyticus]MDF4940383.1 class I SAM-dependent DNA methyltransferase [Vibrio parahaemolyticus]TOK36565.1 DNA methyltransferase [Vibrio parahaemolyticus]HCE3704269.1 SAM-dependent DNA methyltransferase [Vibrio parahaemolyticus]HCG6653112.1 SAM-dependent DNA methyltransferase [Vibrio parahaemolyticus]
MSNVSSIIKSIQDIMRKDVGVDGDAQRISQLVWMFFLKIYDDREAELELLEDDFESPIPEDLRWRNWAANPEGDTGDELNKLVNERLFPKLQTLAIETTSEDESEIIKVQRAKVIRDVFEGTYNYMKSGTLLRQVINKICEINFNNTKDRHTFGSIYEQILKDLQSAGNAGEFYTPRAVTQFIVNRIDPKLDESVLDPACGTGGFLSCSIDHKRNNYVNGNADEEILAKSIYGVEKKALPHMLCTTNMILHGIDTPTQIEHDNMLSRRAYKDYGEKDRVNIIVTNPPFGGMEEDGVENQFPATYKTRETADLFMALVVKLLKNNGRAAVVLPDGFLFGEGMKTRLKKDLVEKCNLHTIVRLPNGVFAPYTGIKTNILFFTKKPETAQPATTHIWFYEHPYPEGVTSYNKSKPMTFEEFTTEIDWWGNEEDNFKDRVENEQAWKVSIEDIKNRNYNLDIKNPHIGEQIKRDPVELLKDYDEQQKEIQSLRDQLKAILSDALSSKGANAK